MLNRMPVLVVCGMWLLGVTSVLAAASYAGTTSYICDFPVFASPSGLEKVKKKFEMRFLSDPQTKKAYLLGNAGSSEVTPVRQKDGGVTFIEVTDTGNVMVTAITASGEAVHSRNGIMFGELIPSQYYGKCTVQ